MLFRNLSIVTLIAATGSMFAGDTKIYVPIKVLSGESKCIVMVGATTSTTVAELYEGLKSSYKKYYVTLEVNNQNCVGTKQNEKFLAKKLVAIRNFTFDPCLQMENYSEYELEDTRKANTPFCVRLRRR